MTPDDIRNAALEEAARECDGWNFGQTFAAAIRALKSKPAPDTFDAELAALRKQRDDHWKTAQIIACDRDRYKEERDAMRKIVEAARTLLHAEGDGDPATDFSQWSLGMLDLRDAIAALGPKKETPDA